MATDWLDDHLDWPDVGRVFLLWRERTIGGVTTIEEVFGITSLRPEQASAADSLELVRQRWSIENQLFGVRDGTLREDAWRVRTGGAAQALAALRNALVHLLADAGFPSTAAAARHVMVHPLEALERPRHPPREGNGPGSGPAGTWHAGPHAIFWEGFPGPGACDGRRACEELDRPIGPPVGGRCRARDGGGRTSIGMIRDRFDRRGGVVAAAGPCDGRRGEG